MNITEFIKKHEATVNYDNKKLFYSKSSNSYYVIQRGYHKHNYQYLIVTENEEEAIEVLING